MELVTAFSNALADAIDAAAPSVVQVKGRRPLASGLVFADRLVLTMVSALGRGDGLHVRRHDGRTHEAELAGWDPATGLAALRVSGLDTTTSIAPAAPPRVGHVALAVARSWSNVVTASSGIVSIIGGPLRTGRHRSIDQVIRTTAPMHDGFAGGAFLDVSGGLIGITTASSIRGLGVVIPTSIAWKVAAALFEHGHVKRGYLGIASHPVRLPVAQQSDPARTEALLVVNVTDGSPAAAAGVLVGDIVVAFDGQPVDSAEDLLNLLIGERVGRDVALELLRGGTATTITVRVGERPAA
jgi:S1-C subfamily serine protease